MVDYNLPNDENEFESLRKEFEPVKGFLVCPDKDGERSPTKFEGVLVEVFGYKDKRKKLRFAAVFVATSDQPCMVWDKESDSELPVEKGDRVGLVISGALMNIVNQETKSSDKLEHFFKLDFTGVLIPTENGEMLEVLAQVSKNPVTMREEKKQNGASSKAKKADKAEKKQQTSDIPF